jgi:hypothetical protein
MPALLVTIVLVVLGLFVVPGAAGSIVLAFGFVGLFGVAVRLITRNEELPREERRVPAGHSGV